MVQGGGFRIHWRHSAWVRIPLAPLLDLFFDHSTLEPPDPNTDQIKKLDPCLPVFAGTGEKRKKKETMSCKTKTFTFFYGKDQVLSHTFAIALSLECGTYSQAFLSVFCDPQLTQVAGKVWSQVSTGETYYEFHKRITKKLNSETHSFFFPLTEGSNTCI